MEEKLAKDIYPLGAKAGGLLPEWAARLGLKAGIAVAVANVDAHVAVPACTVVEPAKMVMIMGTSICHMVCGTESKIVPGMCGVVEDGILPGLFGFEAGQSAVGDIFAWFVENCVPAAYEREAKEKGISVHQLLTEKAAALQPGGERPARAGLVERQPLRAGGYRAERPAARRHADHPPGRDLPRAHRGDRLWHRDDRQYLRRQRRAHRRDLLLRRAGGEERPAHANLRRCHRTPDAHLRLRANPGAGQRHARRGRRRQPKRAAMPPSRTPRKKMARVKDEQYQPIPENQAVYQQLYAEYVKLHDYFGRGENDVMKRLRAIKEQAHVEKVASGG